MIGHPYILAQADATRLPLADDSVQLIVTSPPYLRARTYGINAQRGCVEWIEWMLPIVRECLRVCTGPVIINCAGQTKDHNYQPGPEGLLYEAWKAGIESCRPAQWHRVGIPGSGGKYWLRADTEYCLCFKRPGALPFMDVSKIGHAPKFKPGGEMSYRASDGERRNAAFGFAGRTVRTRPGKGRIELALGESESETLKHPTRKNQDGIRGEKRGTAPRYDGVAFANPGNLLRIKVGGGVMGHPCAHENEAPFPVGVPTFFIKGWTKPGAIVLDPFSGSGTTVDAARSLGRIGIGFDLRMNQCELARRRIENPVSAKPRKEPKSPTEPALFDAA